MTTTADDFETASEALRDAATTLLGYGSTGSAPGADVTATSTKKYVAVSYGDRFFDLWRDLDRGSPAAVRHHHAYGRNGSPESQILMAESDDEILIVARLKKEA